MFELGGFEKASSPALIRIPGLDSKRAPLLGKILLYQPKTVKITNA